MVAQTHARMQQMMMQGSGVVGTVRMVISMATPFGGMAAVPCVLATSPSHALRLQNKIPPRLTQRPEDVRSLVTRSEKQPAAETCQKPVGRHAHLRCIAIKLDRELTFPDQSVWLFFSGRPARGTIIFRFDGRQRVWLKAFSSRLAPSQVHDRLNRLLQDLYGERAVLVEVRPATEDEDLQYVRGEAPVNGFCRI